ncbi:reverse transcriptase domain-containing protein [Tanacetum coccineum]
MGIKVSTVYGAIKFHMPNGVGTIFSEHNSQKSREEEGNLTNNGQGDAKDILSCVDTEEKIVIDDEYLEQKKRSLALERNEAVRTQVEELVEAGILREVKYQTWVLNPIIVKKDDGKWKLCIDFTNINKACTRELHPLPAAKMEAKNLYKYRLKCFLDAYKGYHQISMAEKDEEITAFFTREGVFCYRRLPFGLKNAGATYQRLRDKFFGSQIGRNIEVNTDDMIIKSDFDEEMLADIEETLGRLWAINLKLNPRKCSFKVEEGIYSDHLITKHGIRADPSKCREGPPFHENPKKLHEWKDGSVDNRSKRSLLKNERMLRVIANNGYTNQRYFQAHPIQVLSDMPIKQVLAKPEKSGRVAKWAIKLGEHEIEFKGMNSIKGQILADFLAETSPIKKEEEKNGEAKRKEPEPENTWKLFTDGASSSDGSGAGLMLVNPEGKEYTYALRFEFETTNNEAKYKALIAGLRIAKEMQIQELAIFVDSQLVANQVKGLFEARQQTVKQYLEKTMGLLSNFPSYSIEHIKREQNKKADALSELASMTFSKLAKEVLVEVIQTKSVAEKEITNIVKKDEDNWMVPIREYLKEGIIPKDPQKARKLCIKASLYRMIKERLYRRSYMSLWLSRIGKPFGLVYKSEAGNPYIETSVVTSESKTSIPSEIENDTEKTCVLEEEGK